MRNSTTALAGLTLAALGVVFGEALRLAHSMGVERGSSLERPTYSRLPDERAITVGSRIPL